MEQVLLPFVNKDDFGELDEDIKSAVKIIFVKNVQEVFYHIFDREILRTTEPRRSKKI
jgi:ATP-dependent Lon protease